MRGGERGERQNYAGDDSEEKPIEAQASSWNFQQILGEVFWKNRVRWMIGGALHMQKDTGSLFKKGGIYRNGTYPIDASCE